MLGPGDPSARLPATEDQYADPSVSGCGSSARRWRVATLSKLFGEPAALASYEQTLVLDSKLGVKRRIEQLRK